MAVNHISTVLDSEALHHRHRAPTEGTSRSGSSLPLRITEPFGERRPAHLFRWPGAKWHLCAALAPRLRAHLADTGGCLLSLFHGTGALEQTIDAPVLIAADANPDLRALHAELRRDGGAEVFHELVLLHGAGAPRARAEYERVRVLGPLALSSPARAARFLWLSGLAFNGIWRVNRAGALNVPPDPRRLSHAWPFPLRSELASAGRQLPAQPLFDDWRGVIEQARPGDLILSDPPYLSGFDAYTGARFSLAEHHALADGLRLCALRGCAVVAFNSADARSLYQPWADLETAFRPGRMNCRPDRRGPVGEMLAFAGLRMATSAAP